jgi:histidinol phosphatase-like PHP family hydrolase
VSSEAQAFMDMLVRRAVGILEQEPIDVYVNPTYLPDSIAKDYDRLWTEDRMEKVIRAAAKNQVAIEINDRYKIPNAAFIRRAKEAGCKFTLGTNNTSPNDLGRSEYGLRLIDECKLESPDFFVPQAWWPKAVERKGDTLKA